MPSLPDPKTPISRQTRHVIGNEDAIGLRDMQLLPGIDSELDFPNEYG
ncbi:MAG TPA: hypothetical protein VK581_02795 [Chthoniobacterales bacterium]|nr:hypothetical protein [Chthoniobacterales bacterium]